MKSSHPRLARFFFVQAMLTIPITLSWLMDSPRPLHTLSLVVGATLVNVLFSLIE